MTAATVSTYYPTGLPGVEMAVLELTDGETYTARKLNKVSLALPVWLEDTDGYINCTISGATVTVNAAGASDSVIGLVLFGKK